MRTTSQKDPCQTTTSCVNRANSNSLLSSTCGTTGERSKGKVIGVWNSSWRRSKICVTGKGQRRANARQHNLLLTLMRWNNTVHKRVQAALTHRCQYILTNLVLPLTTKRDKNLTRPLPPGQLPPCLLSLSQLPNLCSILNVPNTTSGQKRDVSRS